MSNVFDEEIGSTAHTRLRATVRGAYAIQKLRVQMGNRIVSAFRKNTGLASSQAELDDAAAAKLFAELRKSYDKIMDGLDELPSAKQFRSKNMQQGMITDYAELMLMDDYVSLEKQEDKIFKKNLPNILSEFPIWTEWMQHVDGLGPAMAGVIISEIDIHKAAYPSSLWKYCFPKNTMVSTMSGMKAINELVVNDKVIDASGFETSVLETMSKTYTGKLLTFKIIGSLPITMTDEHPVLIVRDGVSMWVAAESIIITDKLVVPRLRQNLNAVPSWGASAKAIGKQPILKDGVIITHNSLYLCGRFVGDGSASTWTDKHGDRRGVCQISFGKHEEIDANVCSDLSKEMAGNGYISVNERSLNLVFGRATVSTKFKEWFGYLCHNKKIPDFIMGLSDTDAIKSFLRGYFDADGHIIPDGKSTGTIHASSVSLGLILQLQHLLTKIGIFASIHKQMRDNDGGLINDRLVTNCGFIYRLAITPADAYQIYPIIGAINFVDNPKRKVKENYEGDWLLSIKEISSVNVVDEKVFNLHTASNTYLVQNIAVHNCGLDTVVTNNLGEEDGRGRGRFKEHLVPKTAKDFDGNVTNFMGVSFKPFLKTKLLGVLGTSFLRSTKTLINGKRMLPALRLHVAIKGGFDPKGIPPHKVKDAVLEWMRNNGYTVTIQHSEFGQCYHDYKHRISNMHAHKDKTPFHIHNMAIRFMVKRFLVRLYQEWRALEGLEVVDEYAVRVLGHVHHSAKQPK